VAQIGIKIADGSFFPVLADEKPQRKRTVLSVAQANQGCAQIDILRRENEVDQHVGCLVLEDLQSDEGQELTLVIGIDHENNLEARVDDSAGKHYQSFVVSLDQLDGVEHYSLPEDTTLDGPDDGSLDVLGIESPEDIGIPDMDLPDIDMPDLDDVEFDGVEDDTSLAYDSPGAPFALAGDEELDEDEGSYDDYPQEESRSFSLPVLIALILIVLSVLALGAYGIVRLMGAEMIPELRAAIPLAALPAPVASLGTRSDR
jgi:hypothetical protein